MKPSKNQSVIPKVEAVHVRIFIGIGLAGTGILLGLIGAATSSTALVVIAGLSTVTGSIVGSLTLLSTFKPREIGDDLNSRILNATRIDMDAPVALDGPATDHSVIDDVTGLPDGRFFEVAVDGRVAAARRHLWPVSIVLLKIGFDPQVNTAAARNRLFVAFADLMGQTLREADIACRLSEDTFGLILEDTSEEGGVWTAERIQIALSHQMTQIRRLVAGVAAYPTHGLFAQDVLVRAHAALERAAASPSGHGLGQVEVAQVDLS